MLTKKVLISMDERLLGRVDEAAKARGVNRSRFLSELVEREVGLQPRPPEERQQIAEAFEALHELGRRSFTDGDESSESIIRSERDSR